MENCSLKRTIYFEERGGKDDLIFNYEMALKNWELKDKLRNNSNKLKEVLGVEDIVRIKIECLSSVEESDEFLRLYAYKTKHCDATSLQTVGTSHALQVSLGNDAERSNWVLGEAGFTAKVFLSNQKMMINLVEDVVLDIQMFYFYGLEKQYKDYQERRIFSREKVRFIWEKGCHSYLGYVEDTEYVSFASFCRKGSELEINYKEYVKIWEEFIDRLRKKNAISSVRSARDIINSHPQKGQLSEKKLARLLRDLPSGQYILVRTEKKPKKKRQRLVVENRFGMKKWKTGRMKIVPMKYRYTYQKLRPYVSLYDIDWEQKE